MADDFNDEFDDMNFDDDFDGGMVEDADVSGSGPSAALNSYINGAVAGGLDGAKDSLRREIDMAMPNTMSLYGSVTDTFDSVMDLKDNITDELKPVMRGLKKATNKMLPGMQAFIPKSIYDKLDSLTKVEDDDEKKISAERAKKEARDSELKTAIDGVFGTVNASNMETAAAQMEQANTIQQENRIHNAEAMAVSNIQHKQSMSVSVKLNEGIATLVNFNLGTYTAFLKKDLEVKYKHMFLTKDILESTLTTQKLLEVELKQVVHNTAIPDKSKHTLKTTLDPMHMINQSADQFIQGYGKKVLSNVSKMAKEKIIGSISSAKEGISELSEAIADAKEMGASPEDIANMVRDQLGALGGGVIGDALTSETIQPILEKLPQWTEKAEDLTKNWKYKAVSKAEGLKHKLAAGPFSFLAELFPSFHNSVSIKDDAHSNLQGIADFDNTTRNTIIDIIPGYLARILSQTEALREQFAPSDGSDDDLLKYDRERGEFLRSSKLKARFHKKIFGSDNGQTGVNNAIGAVEHGFSLNADGDANAIKYLRKPLRRFFNNLASNALTLNAKSLMSYLDGIIKHSDDDSDDYAGRGDRTLNIGFQGIPDHFKTPIVRALLAAITRDGKIDRDMLDTINAGIITRMSSENYRKELPRIIEKLGGKEEVRDLLNDYGTGVDMNKLMTKMSDVKNQDSSIDAAASSVGDDMIRRRKNEELRSQDLQKVREHVSEKWAEKSKEFKEKWEKYKPEKWTPKQIYQSVAAAVSDTLTEEQREALEKYGINVKDIIDKVNKKVKKAEDRWDFIANLKKTIETEYHRSIKKAGDFATKARQKVGDLHESMIKKLKPDMILNLIREADGKTIWDKITLVSKLLALSPEKLMEKLDGYTITPKGKVKGKGYTIKVDKLLISSLKNNIPNLTRNRFLNALFPDKYTNWNDDESTTKAIQPTLVKSVGKGKSLFQEYKNKYLDSTGITSKTMEASKTVFDFALNQIPDDKRKDMIKEWDKFKAKVEKTKGMTPKEIMQETLKIVNEYKLKNGQVPEDILKELSTDKLDELAKNLKAEEKLVKMGDDNKNLEKPKEEPKKLSYLDKMFGKLKQFWVTQTNAIIDGKRFKLDESPKVPDEVEQSDVNKSEPTKNVNKSEPVQVEPSKPKPKEKTVELKVTSKYGRALGQKTKIDNGDLQSLAEAMMALNFDTDEEKARHIEDSANIITSIFDQVKQLRDKGGDKTGSFVLPPNIIEEIKEIMDDSGVKTIDPKRLKDVPVGFRKFDDESIKGKSWVPRKSDDVKQDKRRKIWLDPDILKDPKEFSKILIHEVTHQLNAQAESKKEQEDIAHSISDKVTGPTIATKLKNNLLGKWNTSKVYTTKELKAKERAKLEAEGDDGINEENRTFRDKIGLGKESIMQRALRTVKEESFKAKNARMMTTMDKSVFYDDKKESDETSKTGVDRIIELLEKYQSYRKIVDGGTIASIEDIKSYLPALKKKSILQKAISGAFKLTGLSIAATAMTTKAMTTGAGAIIGGVGHGLGSALGGLFRGGGSVIGGTATMVGNVLGLPALKLFDKKWYDVYIKGHTKDAEVLITAKDQKKGLYVFEDMSKPKRTSDITKPLYEIVMDEDSKKPKRGNQIITQKDIQKGLVTKDGTPIEKTSFRSKIDKQVLAGQFINAFAAIHTAPIKAVGSIISSTIGLLGNRGPRYVDIYKKGQIERGPILLARDQKEGLAVYKNGKRVKRSSDIDQPVWLRDASGVEKARLAITKEDIVDGLVDSENKPILKGGLGIGRAISKSVGGVIGMITGGITASTDLWTDLVKKGADLATTGFKGIMNRLFGTKVDIDPILKKMDKSQEVLNDLVKELKCIGDDIEGILDYVESTKIAGDADGDGDRDGSYKDQQSRRRRRRRGRHTDSDGDNGTTSNPEIDGPDEDKGFIQNAKDKIDYVKNKYKRTRKTIKQVSNLRTKKGREAAKRLARRKVNKVLDNTPGGKWAKNKFKKKFGGNKRLKKMQAFIDKRAKNVGNAANKLSKGKNVSRVSNFFKRVNKLPGMNLLKQAGGWGLGIMGTLGGLATMWNGASHGDVGQAAEGASDTAQSLGDAGQLLSKIPGADKATSFLSKAAPNLGKIGGYGALALQAGYGARKSILESQEEKMKDKSAWDDIMGEKTLDTGYGWLDNTVNGALGLLSSPVQLGKGYTDLYMLHKNAADETANVDTTMATVNAHRLHKWGMKSEADEYMKLMTSGDTEGGQALYTSAYKKHFAKKKPGDVKKKPGDVKKKDSSWSGWLSGTSDKAKEVVNKTLDGTYVKKAAGTVSDASKWVSGAADKVKNKADEVMNNGLANTLIKDAKSVAAPVAASIVGEENLKDMFPGYKGSNDAVKSETQPVSETGTVDKVKVESPQETPEVTHTDITKPITEQTDEIKEQTKINKSQLDVLSKIAEASTATAEFMKNFKPVQMTEAVHNTPKIKGSKTKTPLISVHKRVPAI